MLLLGCSERGDQNCAWKYENICSEVAIFISDPAGIQKRMKKYITFSCLRISYSWSLWNSQFNLLEDNPLEMVEDLMEKFDALEETPVCFNLSSTALYGNAKRYLEQLKR